MTRQRRQRAPALQDFKDFRQLVEIQGPFVSTGVLREVFPQGFPSEESLSTDLNALRLEYEDWLTAPQFDRAAHDKWIRSVLSTALEFDNTNLLIGQGIPQSIHLAISPAIVIASAPEEGLVSGETTPGQPLFPAFVYAKGERLDTSIDHSIAYLRQTNFSIALVTNGEQWVIVHAPADGVTSTAVWYAEIWWEERLTFRAFRALLGARRWFNVAETETLPALLKRSEDNQGAITKQLGRQVRQAVEVLIHSLDRADQDKNRGLLADVPVETLYEATLSVMMRLIFLFFAEERELLPANDELYAEAYAVSTIREQLQAAADRFGPEVLERRHDAWSRLLATFRAVHAGLGHDRLTLPAYGGQLFDPDRYPFLEGRPAGSSWRDTKAAPLPVDNRTILYVLDALQTLQEAGESRRISFRELDVPDIGHIYESLLDHTAKRAGSLTLGLEGAGGKEPEEPLVRLEEWRLSGEERLLEELNEVTGKSASTISKLLAKEVEPRRRERLRTGCRGDDELLDRVLPFAHLVRMDQWDQPVIMLPGSVFVTEGQDRRSTGTHYTPTSLTEPIVQYALEPVVYTGPEEGLPRDQWTLKSPAELLKLKVCDMACGSGAFLVAATRYLAARLQEAWAASGAFQPGAPRRSPDGFVSQGGLEEDLIPLEPEAREAYALRSVAQRCIYGVDVNPLAAEMAKLSLWLLTLAKGKPFTFLDHAIKSGDSLIGVNREQLEAFDLDDVRQPRFGFGPTLDSISDTRRTIAMVRAESLADVEKQARMLADAEKRTEALRWIGDALIGMELKGVDEGERVPVGTELGLCVQHHDFDSVNTITARYRNGIRPFHWQLEFPEVFEDGGGFDAIIANPPYIGASRISSQLDFDYREFLVRRIAKARRGLADYSAYFVLQALRILGNNGLAGLIATKTIAQGETKRVGLDQAVGQGACIIRAITSRKWPGEANLHVSLIWLRSASWRGWFVLDNQPASGISSALTSTQFQPVEPNRLKANLGICLRGSELMSEGFILDQTTAADLLRWEENRDVVRPYLGGKDITERPDLSPSRWVINFRDWPIERSRKYSRCFELVEAHVRPYREGMSEGDASARDRARRWWQFGRPTRELYDKLSDLERAIVAVRVSAFHVLSIVPSDVVFSDRLVVFLLDGWHDFALLTSDIHEAWAHRAGMTTHETRNTYFPKSAFETFPFPEDHSSLRRIGEAYHSTRAQILRSRNVGLTDFYNVFHNRGDLANDIEQMHDLHIQLDHAVASAYGWDFDLGHGFHETKQGIRFTMSPQARAKALDLLLALNHERYAAEQRQTPTNKKKSKRSKSEEAPLLAML